MPDNAVKLAVNRRSVPGLGAAYAPSSSGPCPAVLVLHGSEGGLAGWSHCTAIMLAVHGFLAVPFSYAKGGNGWHAGDIVDVPLDDTANALARLARSPMTVGGVGLYGASRGAEHALLLATLMSQDGCPDPPRAVAVHAAADTVHGAWRSARAWPEGTAAASGGGARDRTIPIELPQSAPVREAAWSWHGTTDRVRPGTPIVIEAYRGPVLLSHGTADRIWASGMTERLAARLTAAGREPALHLYPGEGHCLGAEAANHHMAALIAFYRTHLGG
jgi:dienelactone hydrolase